MSCHVELTEEEILCLHQYFQRVDETEDLSFLYPAEYVAFQRIARQVCKASAAMLKSNYNRLIELARQSVGGGASGDWTAPKAASRAMSRTGIAVPVFGVPKSTPSPTVAGDAFAVPPAEPYIEALLRDCVAGFEAGDVEKAIALFSFDARIVSPFRGCQTAREFLSQVVAEAGGARITFHEMRANVEGRPQALGYFLYDGWRTSADDRVMDDVDVFNLVLNVDAWGTSIQSMIVL
jgi:hypothetical protein